MSRFRYNPDDVFSNFDDGMVDDGMVDDGMVDDGMVDDGMVDDAYIEKLLSQGYQEVSLLASDGPVVVESTPQDDADPTLGYDYGDDYGYVDDEYVEYDEYGNRQNPALSASQMSDTELVERLRPYINPSIGSNIYSINVERFTDLPKFGLNPKNEYDTPTGLYWYDSDVKHEEFGTRRKYILRAQLKGVGVELSQLCPLEDIKYSNRFALPVVDRLIEEIKNKLKVKVTVDEVLEESGKFIERTVKGFLFKKYREAGDKPRDARKKSHKTLPAKEWASVCGPAHTAALWWSVTRKAAQKLAKKQKREVVNAWTTVFRALGIEFIIDPGFGVIHEAEPEQAVSFSINVVHNQQIEDNPKRKYGSQKVANLFRFIAPRRPLLGPTGLKLPLRSIEYLVVDKTTRTFERKTVSAGQKISLSIVARSEELLSSEAVFRNLEFTVGAIFPDAVLMQTEIGTIDERGTIFSEAENLEFSYRAFWRTNVGALLSWFSVNYDPDGVNDDMKSDSGPAINKILLQTNLSDIDSRKQTKVLAGCDFSELDLAQVSFMGLDLRGSVFDGACLDGSYFEYAELFDCSFRNASILRAYFNDAEYSHTDFTGADMRQSEISIIFKIPPLPSEKADEGTPQPAPKKLSLDEFEVAWDEAIKGTSFANADMRGVSGFSSFWRQLPSELRSSVIVRNNYPHFFQGTNLQGTFLGSRSEFSGSWANAQKAHGMCVEVIEAGGGFATPYKELGWKPVNEHKYPALLALKAEVTDELIRKALLRVPPEKMADIQAKLFAAQMREEQRLTKKLTKVKPSKEAVVSLEELLAEADQNVKKKAKKKAKKKKVPALVAMKKATKKKATKKMSALEKAVLKQAKEKGTVSYKGILKKKATKKAKKKATKKDA